MSGISESVLYGIRQNVKDTKIKVEAAVDACKTALNNELVTRHRFEAFVNQGFVKRFRWLFLGK